MEWVFLSPHFDDVVFSCGGLIWEKTRAGDSVQVWTICAGEIPEGNLSPFARQLHDRWGADKDAIAVRRKEDILACQKIGARFVHLPIPDCIYRKASSTHQNKADEEPQLKDSKGSFLYPTEESIFGTIHSADQRLITALVDRLSSDLPADAHLVSPLAVGNHVDHQITRKVAEAIANRIYYYADFPYLLKTADLVDQLVAKGWQDSHYNVTRDGLQAWFDSITAYQSQISTFWPDLEGLRGSLSGYLEKNDGIKLWRAPKQSLWDDFHRQNLH